MTDHQESPILESAKWRGKTGPLPWIVFFSVIWIPVALLCLVITIATEQNPPMDMLAVTIAVFVIPIAAFIWVLRHPLFDHEWETSNQGILAKGLFRKRFVNWADITKVETRYVRMFMCQCYVLKTQKQTIVVPQRDALLGASIYYHLDKLDKASDIELTKNMQCFLNLRVENMPDEVSWQNLRPYSIRNAFVRTVVRVAPFILIIAALLLTHHYDHALGAAIVTVCLHHFGFLKPLFVMGVAINKDYIEVLEAIGLRVVAMRIHWVDINLASWVKHELFLRSAKGGGVIIPWQSEDLASTRLILSIISRLQSAESPVDVSVPEAIAQAWESR